MTTFLRNNKIAFNENDKLDTLTIHFDALCFNIASIVSVLALINDNKINDKIISEVKKYIDKQCDRTGSKIKKGGSMPSDYYGYTNSTYTYANENTGTITGTIDFDNGIQRPSLGPQSGGGATTGGFPVLYDENMKNRVKGILMKNKLNYKEKLNDVMTIINDNLHYLVKTLKKKQPITSKKLEKLFESKKYAVFN